MLQNELTNTLQYNNREESWLLQNEMALINPPNNTRNKTRACKRFKLQTENGLNSNIVSAFERNRAFACNTQLQQPTIQWRVSRHWNKRTAAAERSKQLNLKRNIDRNWLQLQIFNEYFGVRGYRRLEVITHGTGRTWQDDQHTRARAFGNIRLPNCSTEIDGENKHEEQRNSQAS